MNPFQHFQHFITKLAQIKDLYLILEHYEDSYALKKYRISEISPNNALTLLQNITKKFYKYYQKGESGIWFENELRLFVWILVCYMEFSKKHLRQFTPKDWEFFSNVLYVKQTCLFEYQARIILDYSLCLRKWSQQQDSLLIKIVMGAQRTKWNQIAKLLFASSERAYTRTSKQCRERWLNHLDPCKTKLSWTLEEIQCLFEAVLEKGKKWASLVQILKGKRSEHSIKNKYNSILIRQSKLTPECNERQNCEQILEKIANILKTNHIEAKDELLFGELSKVIKQNQNSIQQNFLTTSNASLQKSLPTRDNDYDNTLNFYDFIAPSPSSTSTVNTEIVVEMMQMPKKKKTGRKGKFKQTQNLVSQNYNDILFEEGGDSLIGLEQLKLVIRESELDR